MAKREGDLVGAGVPVRDCVRDRGVKDMIGSTKPRVGKRAFSGRQVVDRVHVAKWYLNILASAYHPAD
jgi:hypothetical protein